MGMNKMFKKVLAVVAAGAMTMGMAMPTFAAEGATTAKVTEAYVSKTYNREVEKAEKFSFTATQVKKRNRNHHSGCCSYDSRYLIYSR